MGLHAHYMEHIKGMTQKVHCDAFAKLENLT